MIPGHKLLQQHGKKQGSLRVFRKTVKCGIQGKGGAGGGGGLSDEGKSAWGKVLSKWNSVWFKT